MDAFWCVSDQCIHGEVCNTFTDYFSVKSGTVNTRNNGFLAQLPKIKLEAARASFYFQGAATFNALPLVLRKESDTKRFKRLLKEI